MRNPLDPGEWFGGRGRFESEEYDNGEQPSRRRFEQFDEWEKPRELREYGRHVGDPGRSASRQRAHRRRGYEPTGRYAGLGPKGYQRSDDRLKEDVCDRLTEDPEIDASGLTVSVEASEVTLEGSIESHFMKRAAEDCVESISGVRQVHNRLRVEPNREHHARKSSH